MPHVNLHQIIAPVIFGHYECERASSTTNRDCNFEDDLLFSEQKTFN